VDFEYFKIYRLFDLSTLWQTFYFNFLISKLLYTNDLTGQTKEAA
jgi:hypothetical protein